MIYSPAEIRALQSEQRIHDDLYHPDISRLDLSRRIAHLILHLSKYCGDISVADVSGNDEAANKALVDCAIISLSAATALNLDIANARTTGDGLPAELGFLMSLVVRVGRLAKAAEAYDHVEDFPFRRVWEHEFSCIFRMAVLEIEARQMPIRASAFSQIRRRLDFVKSRNNFTFCGGSAS